MSRKPNQPTQTCNDNGELCWYRMVLLTNDEEFAKNAASAVSFWFPKVSFTDARVEEVPALKAWRVVVYNQKSKAIFPKIDNFLCGFYSAWNRMRNLAKANPDYVHEVETVTALGIETN